MPEKLETLVMRAQTGDHEAYSAIVQRFSDMALKHAFSIVGDYELADDARQEAFLGAYCDLMNLREPAAFPGWFLRIVQKHSIQIVHQRRRLMCPLEGADNLTAYSPKPDQVAAEDETTPDILDDPPNRDIKSIVPSQLIEVSTRLKEKISNQPSILYSLSPRVFEEYIAEIFAGFGYTVELTAQTRDGGRDIVAVSKNHDILSKLLIECKKFAPDRPVGISYVRELYAVKTLEHATKAILVTTSYFSPDSRRFESQYVYELELKDFEAVTHWAKNYLKLLRKIRSGK